jgi:hypothetical protein
MGMRGGALRMFVRCLGERRRVRGWRMEGKAEIITSTAGWTRLILRVRLEWKELNVLVPRALRPTS